jgi:hypothetical protein
LYYLYIYIYNKTSIKRNILTIKQNTWVSRSGKGVISTAVSTVVALITIYFSETRFADKIRCTKHVYGQSLVPLTHQVLRISDLLKTGAMYLTNRVLRNKFIMNFLLNFIFALDPTQRIRYSDSLRAIQFWVRNPARARHYVFSKNLSCWLSGPPSLLFSGCRSSFTGVKRPGREVYH